MQNISIGWSDLIFQFTVLFDKNCCKMLCLCIDKADYKALRSSLLRSSEELFVLRIISMQTVVSEDLFLFGLKIETSPE